MGTVMNGKKWASACVNGKVVSGLVKNGVVFYRKPVSAYKRRIMVGDNLSYKTIYCDFPENYYQIISEEMGTGNQRQAIISDVKTTYIVENNLSPNFEVRVINGVQWQNNIYNYQNGNLITNLTSLSLENFGNVMTVNDNQAYRHIYVVDPNVRPIQVGDVITSTTKFYFTFPDDFYGYIENNISPGKRLKIVELDNSIGGKFISVENYQGIASAFYLAAFFVNNSSTSDRHIYNYNTNSSLINKSNMTSAFSGTVTNVNKNNQSYQHILVDKTTLGA